jgi:hypothetical protein
MSVWDWVAAALLWCEVAVLAAVVIGRFIERASLLAEMRAEEKCADGCGRAATHERFEAATTDGIPIVALTCHQHAGDGRPR